MKKYFLFVFLFMVIFAAWLYPAIPQSERDALIALYNSTDGDNWVNNTNWRKPGDPLQFNDPGTENTWFGVNCDAGNTRVQTLTMTFNNLSGTIPSDLNALTWLTNLDLSCNQLTGTIPDLSSLDYLVYLKLYQNNLSGNIPTWLNNLSVYHLNLYNNQFTGTIPDLSNHTGLGYLSLGGNQLTGTIPTWLNSLPYLYTLNLEGNQLTGTIPDLSSMTTLQYIYLSSNQLSGTIPTWLNSFTSLYHLEMRDNQFTGVIPDLSSLTDLQVLDLRSNQLSGTIPAWLNTLTQMLTLYLSNNQFTGTIPDLGSLTNLRYLYLENNQLSGDIPAGIGYLHSLEHLYLNGNKLTGSLPATLDGLTSLINNTSGGGLNISWNGLYTDDTGLRDFLNTKQVGGDWESTQTIAPVGLYSSEEADTSVKISWTPIQYQTGTGGYQVFYSTTTGGPYTLDHTTADKTVDNYTVTDLDPGTTYYFVVKTITNSHANNQNTVVSEYSQEITGITTGGSALTLTDPMPGAVLMQEGMAVIMWTTNGTVDNVELYYSTDSGGSWIFIDGPIINTGSYDWMVPPTPSTECLVRVKDAAGETEDITDGLFTIRAPSITVLHPNGGQVLMQESMSWIEWDYEGNVSTVDLYYSPDSGATWIPIDSIPASSRWYDWIVPPTPSGECLVRVADAAGYAEDISDMLFTIRAPSITVLHPNGGQVLMQDSMSWIEWDYEGNVSTVELYYSPDSGATWIPIDSVPASSRWYDWIVPPTPSGECLVRVADAAGYAEDISDMLFTIRAPSITVLHPNGGEVLMQETSSYIEWGYEGNVNTVNLYYSPDSGATWIPIDSVPASSGFYDWIVPPTPSGECLVRVADAAGYAEDISDMLFTIRAPSITVLHPNGGEVLMQETSSYIEWGYEGNVSTVNLYYSPDSGATWIPIDSVPASPGFYDWIVPPTPSGECLVRVADAAGYAEDISDTLFTIQSPSISVTMPNGTENWQANSSQTIAWTYTGNITEVVLEYSTDSGVNWTNIAGPISNAGTYDWTVPDEPSSECLVRVLDAAGYAEDISDELFTISSSSISSTQRDALIALYTSTDGDNWTNNTNWRLPGNPSQFNDPGTEHTWFGVTCTPDQANVIEINLPSNFLNGTLPDLSGLISLTKLDLGNNQLTGTLPATINNLANLQVLDLGANFINGTLPDLSGLTNLTQLDLSVNLFSGNIPTWLNMLTALNILNLSENQFTGTIPDLGSLGQLTQFNVYANLLSGAIPTWLNSLTALNTLHLGLNQFSGTIPDLGALTQLNELNLYGNQLTGSIPAWVNSLTALTKLDLSANQLTGTIPDLDNLTALIDLYLQNNDLSGSIPNLGSLTSLEYCHMNNNQLSGSIPDINGLTSLYRLDLSGNQLSGGIPAEIGTLTGLRQLFLHGNKLGGPLPSSITNLTNLLNNNSSIRWNALYTDDPGIRDFMNTKQYTGDWESTQTIAPIGVTAGEATNDTVKVSWTPIAYQSGGGGYMVYYTTTSGSGYTLSGTTADKAADNYTVTGLSPNNTYYFVVEAFTASHVNNQNTVISEYSAEVSADTLETPTLTVTAPNGGQDWEAFTTQAITWNSTGGITDVKIEYSTNNGASWNTIIATTPDSGTYNWTVPDTPSSNCLVKVSDIGALAEDTSDGVFTISQQRTITVTAPNGTENWEGGTDQNITWNSTGSIPNVQLEYSTDNGAGWNTIMASTGNSGTYSWTVPNTPSGNCLVRISDTAGPAEDSSDGVFTILEQRTLTLTAPNGTETWEGGTTQLVTWTSTGVITNVMIEYSTNSGSTWNTVIASTANTGSYNWLVPNTPSSSCLVRISDTAGPAADTSNSLFRILEQRTITVTAPNNGENWPAYSYQDITWIGTGAIGSVYIDYSTDNGAAWTRIVLTGNTGTYNWQVPYELSTTCLVKISDASGAAVDTSDAVFTISPPRIPQNQRDALIALYNSTDGDNWILKSNWRKPGDPTQFNDPGTENTWYGITLTEDNVTEIDLPANNLIGTLPDLRALTELEVLDLHQNSISGNIPAWMNDMVSLRIIDLYWNQLDGTITDLSNLTQLISLSLGFNNLSGEIPTWLNSLVNLFSLNLGSNNLTGTIPDLSNLTGLNTCNLADNQLTGTIPTWFNQLTGITVLYLNNNQLSGTIPDLGNLGNLGYFILDSNQLSGTIPAWLNNCTNLRNLNLNSNQLSGAIPDLGNLTLLTNLQLIHNQLTGAIPPGLGSLTQLQYLYLGDNRLSGAIPTEIGNLTNLKALHLESNQLVGSIPGTLTNLTSLGATSLLINWNGLYTDDINLKNFLDSKDAGSDWDETQTIAPTDLSAGEETHESIKISWTPILYQADSGEYRVYYSTTSGGNYNLAGTTADKTIDNYTVTGLDPATTYYFVVEAFTDTHTNNQNTITSEYSIEISAATQETPTLTVTAPNGGQSWEAFTTENITWNSTGNITDVKIEYTTDTGATWNTVIASTANSGSYNWTVPNTPSTNCLVKITDIGGLAVDTSDAVFTIAEQRTLTVTAPNGTENWEGGTSQNITWTSTGSIANVKIEYSTDNGGAWNTIAASTANTGSYNWTVANTPSGNCLVKISDTAGPAADTSNGVFTIAEQRTLTVTAPNGAENWEGGTTQTITWNSTGGIANVRIEYSTNNGSSWNSVEASTTNDGNYNWTVPNTPSSNCLVRISDTAGPAADTSNGVFTIAEQRTLTVTAPNGTENWEGGTNHTITWNSTGSIVNVQIEYSTNNGSSWNSVEASTTNDGNYNWTVPNTPSSNCLVRISDTAGPAVDTSNGVFTIAEQRTLTVTAPNGSENWEGGTTQTITWTSTGGIANVQIEYSTNNGSSWNTVESSTTNDGNYNWTVPNTPSSNCLVRISDTAGPAVDTSNGVFTIAEQRTLTVTAPNGTENWEGGTNHTITWNSTGSIVNVQIEYSTNNGSSWNSVEASTTNDGNYNWTVPNTPSSNCLVRISDTAGSAVDTSNGVFTIAEQRTLTVTAPNGSENWEGGTTQTITWSSTGSIANVQIEYSINNGSSWNTVAASTTNDGNYNWTVSNTPSGNCLVRISDTAGPAVDTSNGVFTIVEQRTVTVTAPNGGQRWFIGNDYTVTWTSTGAISGVMLEYSTNNGGTWNTIISSTANSGSYNWTIPDTPSTNCLVRISDTAGPAVDTGNGVFTIDPFPTLTVQVPNGGQSWEEGNTETITWTYTGTIADVEIEYSANGGSSWNSIVSSTANTGSYNWVIPAVESANCLVRVSDTATTASDVSDEVFTLWKQPSITVTAPNGGETWARFSVQTITWTTTGNIQDVKIQYSDDAGVNWYDVVTSTPNNGSYQWTVPSVNKDKTECLVKIMTIDGTVVDTSDNYFTILKF